MCIFRRPTVYLSPPCVSPLSVYVPPCVCTGVCMPLHVYIPGVFVCPLHVYVSSVCMPHHARMTLRVYVPSVCISPPCVYPTVSMSYRVRVYCSPRQVCLSVCLSSSATISIATVVISRLIEKNTPASRLRDSLLEEVSSFSRNQVCHCICENLKSSCVECIKTSKLRRQEIHKHQFLCKVWDQRTSISRWAAHGEMNRYHDRRDARTLNDEGGVAALTTVAGSARSRAGVPPGRVLVSIKDSVSKG